MKLPASIVAVLTVVAGVLEVVQQYAIPMSSSAHTIVAFVLFIMLGIGVVPKGANALGRLIPLHIAAILTSVAGVLATVQQLALNVPPAVHSILAIALLILAAIGIVPSHLGASTATAKT